MGKSKKRQRSRSRDSSEDGISRKELSKRIKRLEKMLKEKTPRSEAAHSTKRRSRSPGWKERGRHGYPRASAASPRPLPRGPSVEHSGVDDRSAFSGASLSENQNRASLSHIGTVLLGQPLASLSRPGSSLSPLRVRTSLSPGISEVSLSPNRSRMKVDRRRTLSPIMSNVTRNYTIERSPDVSSCENQPLVLHEDVVLSDDLSNILGEDITDNCPPAENLHEAIAKRWGHIVMQSLNKDIEKSILNRYPVPENCTQLNPPLLNPEIMGILGNDRVARDRFNLEIQTNIGKALSAMGKSMSILLKETENIPKKIRDEVLLPLGDSGRILSNLMYNISASRRKLIIPSLKKSLKEVMEKTVPSEYLFGSDVPEKIKMAKALESTGKELKVIPPTFSQPTRGQKKGGGQLRRPPRPYQTPARDHHPLNRQGPARHRGEVKPKGQPLKDHRGGTYRGKR